MTPALAHALPRSIGAVPLTLVLTAMLAAYLAVGAWSTRRAAAAATRLRQQPGSPDAAPGATAPAADPAAAPDPAAAADPAAGPPPGRARVVGPASLLGLLGLAAIAVLAVAGPADAAVNIADVAVLSVLWGAVGITSIFAGGWWPAVDPVRTLAAGVAVAAGEPLDPDRGTAAAGRSLPSRAATAAAVASLLVWAWGQLLAPPRTWVFQALLLAHLVVHVSGTLRHGGTWSRQVEPLTVLSRTLGLLRPAGGGPWRRLIALPDSAHLRWVAGALIGWSLVDLLLETDWWHEGGPAQVGGADLALLLAGIVGVGALVDGVSRRARLGPAFVAVAGGWVIAHYLSVLLLDGQAVITWLSDPLGTGADLLGRAGDRVDTELLPLGLLAALQSIPFVAGHLLGLAVVQRRAAALVSRPGQLGAVTFFARTVIGGLLLGGTYLQLGGV